MPKLSVIILSYNTAEVTKQCLQSLFKSLNSDPSLDYEVIVVDNGSKDNSMETLEKIHQAHNFLKVVKNTENTGFPKGNNQGLKLASGKYILFLNSDVIIDKVRFGQLLNYFDSRPEVGAMTVRVNLKDGSIDPASHRGFPTLWNSFCYFLKLEKLGKPFAGYHLNYLDLSTIHEIDSPSGAFYLARKDVLDKVGGFDTDYFMYGEDLDLSYRIKDLGYKIIYYPLFKVTHLKYTSGLKTDGETKRQTKKHFYDAMKIFYKKHYDSQHPTILNWIIYLMIDGKNKIA